MRPTFKEEEEMPWVPRGSLKKIKSPKNRREIRINRLLEQYNKLENFCLKKEDEYEELAMENNYLIDYVKEIVKDEKVFICKNNYISMWTKLRPHLSTFCRTCALRSFFMLPDYQTGLTNEKGRGYIYFIELNGFIKIGMTKQVNPFKRITTYITENPGRLKLLWLIETYNSTQLEKNLHEIFIEKGYHHNREWFNIKPKALINILSNLREVYSKNKAIFMLKKTYNWFNYEGIRNCSLAEGGSIKEAEMRDRYAGKMKNYIEGYLEL